MDKKLRLLTLSALFSAMIVALTTFIKFPVGNGYVHMGDSIIYLASCILPLPYAASVAAVGGALADALGGYAIYIVPSAIIKITITLPFTSKNDRILTKRNAVMVIPAGVITIVGYFITGLMFFGWSGAVVGLVGDAIQATSNAVLFLVFSAALDKAKIKEIILGRSW